MGRMDKLYEDAKKMLEMYDWRPEIKCQLYISLALLRSASLMEESRRQIIRCKDCKWFNKLGCAIWIKDDSDKPTENDYCSFAEKRGEQDD